MFSDTLPPAKPRCALVLGVPDAVLRLFSTRQLEVLFILLFALVGGGAVAPAQLGGAKGVDGANYPTASSSYMVSPGNSRARRSRFSPLKPAWCSRRWSVGRKQHPCHRGACIIISEPGSLSHDL